MPGQLHNDIASHQLLIGKLVGRTDAVAAELQNVKGELVRVWQAQDEANRAVSRIEAHTAGIATISGRLDDMERQCYRRHGDDTTVKYRKKPSSSPLEKPIGRTLAEWGLEALKKVLVLAVAGLIVFAIAKAFPSESDRIQSPLRESP